MEPVACPDCDLLHAQVPLGAGETARCSRCAGALPTAGPRSFERPLATVIAAAIMFWIANTEPLIRVSALGVEHTATLSGSAAALWAEQGLADRATAILVAFCSILAPGALATLQKDILIAQYERTIQTAFSEVANGLAARGTYGEQVAQMERYTAAEQRALNLSRAMFEAGSANYLTVLTAQTTLYNAQIQLVATRLARLTSLVDLYQVLGGGWIERTGDTPRPADVTAGGPADQGRR